MNRRSFLKRIAAVVAGAVAVPTVVKKLPWTSYSMTYKLKQARDNTVDATGRKIFTNKGTTYIYVKHTEHKMLDGRVFYTFTKNKEGGGQC